MIGKAKCISHTRASLEYASILEKGSSLVRSNLLPDSIEDMLAEMSALHRYNHRCRNNTIRIELSPDPKDAVAIKISKWPILVGRFLEELGKLLKVDINDHQWVAFRHEMAGRKNNIHRPHAHIYINRIGFDGVAIKDQFIGKKAQLAAREVANRLGLKSAGDKRDERIATLNDAAKDLATWMIQQAKASKDLDEFILKTKSKDYQVVKHYNAKGELAGLKYVGEHTVKLSDIHRSLSFAKIGQYFGTELAQAPPSPGHDQSPARKKNDKDFGMSM